MCYPASYFYYDIRPGPGVYEELHWVGTRATALRDPKDFTQNEPVKREHFTLFTPTTLNKPFDFIPPIN